MCLCRRPAAQAPRSIRRSRNTAVQGGALGGPWWSQKNAEALKVARISNTHARSLSSSIRPGMAWRGVARPPTHPHPKTRRRPGRVATPAGNNARTLFRSSLALCSCVAVSFCCCRRRRADFCLSRTRTSTVFWAQRACARAEPTPCDRQTRMAMHVQQHAIINIKLRRRGRERNSSTGTDSLVDMRRRLFSQVVRQAVVIGGVPHKVRTVRPQCARPHPARPCPCLWKRPST